MVERPRGPSAICPEVAHIEPGAEGAAFTPESTTARTPGSVFSRSPAPTSAFEHGVVEGVLILSTRTMRTSATPSSMLMVTRSFMAGSSVASNRCAADVGEGKREPL